MSDWEVTSSRDIQRLEEERNQLRDQNAELLGQLDAMEFSYNVLNGKYDRLREALDSAYKISVCYFPHKHEIEATWEDSDGNVVAVAFPIDEETGNRLAEIVPCGAYHQAALQETRDE